MRTAEQWDAAYTWLRIGQVATRLDASYEHVRGLIRDGALPAIDIGRGDKKSEYRIDPKDFERFLEARRVA